MGQTKMQFDKLSAVSFMVGYFIITIALNPNPSWLDLLFYSDIGILMAIYWGWIFGGLE